MQKQGLIKYVHEQVEKEIGLLILIIFFSFITSCMTIMMSIANKQLIDNYYVIKNEMFFNITIVLSVSFLIIGLLNYLSQIFQTKFNNTIKMRKQLSFYKSVQDIDYQFYCKNNSSNFLYRMFTDVSSVIDFYFKLVVDTPIRVLALIITLILMFYWSIELSILALALVLVQWIVTICFIKPLNRHLKQLKEKEQDIFGKIHNDFQNLDVIRSFGMEDYRYNFALNSLLDYIRHDLNKKKVSSLYHEIINAINGIGGILILIFGLYFAKLGMVSLGTIMGFSILVTYFGSSVSAIIGLFTQYLHSRVAYNRVIEYSNKLDRRNQIKTDKLLNNYNIIIRHLSYKYDNFPVYRKFNLQINEGEIVLIKGPNGSGKSTLCKLLARLLYPQEGNIYIGNYNIEDIDISDFRKKVLLLNQATVFDDSIRRNIDYNAEFSEEQIKGILQKCNLDKMLGDKNWGLDNPNKINHSELSQGEKQKFALARTLIREPKILILDEPTANLDDITTKQILDILIEYNKDKKSTIIITSHDQRVDKYINRVINL